MAVVTVRNKSGQVASLSVDGEADPRAVVIAQRVAQGELERVVEPKPVVPPKATVKHANHKG